MSDRLYIECCPCESVHGEEPYNDTFDEMVECRDAAGELPFGVHTLNVGTIRAAAHGASRWLACGTLDQFICGTANELIVPPGLAKTIPLELVTPMREVALRNAMTAIEEIIHIEGLGRFSGWPEVPESHAGTNPVFQISPNGTIELP